MTSLIRKWSGDADTKLQDSFASTDWTMFRDSSDGIRWYTTTITGFINKSVDDVVPTVTVRTCPNQKPWITGNIRTELKGRAKGQSCHFQGAGQAKRKYRTKIESYHTNSGCGRA